MKNKTNEPPREIKPIAQNKKAFHDFEVLEKIEAGVALLGAEVKSVRQGGLSLADSFATCDSGEMFVHHMHISPYQNKGYSIAEPYRKRKLLLHKNQILRLCSEVERKHLTIIPLKVYFDKHWVKMELGLCRGMKKYDKRDKIASEETKRRLAQIMRERGKR
ncbi:MAG TPA: SsrA-binding protein SmpB [Chitinivibrionales bacterium]|nr:SsrA-binding protein SmpB [Chitinivibrionales bacterium]